jgi:hypothetical protein
LEQLPPTWLRLAKVGFKKYLSSNLEPQIIKSTTAKPSTKAPLAPNACYAQGFIVVCALRFLKYSKISFFVILDNFALNLSRC